LINMISKTGAICGAKSDGSVIFWVTPVTFLNIGVRLISNLSGL
jgi:hypothetical protein